MKYEFIIHTEKRCCFVLVNNLLQEAIQKSGIQDGVCHVFVPHTTAAVTINENADPNVVRDILMELDKIVPLQDHYSHSEGNSAAHIKSSILGASAIVLVEKGQPILGTWQSLYFCEFDGPRTRRLWIRISPE